MGAVSDQVIGGLQNIRAFAGVVVSLGWIVAMATALTKIDPADAGEDAPLVLGLIIAVGYLLVVIAFRFKQFRSESTSFALTVLFVPMVMLSFAMAIDHTLESAVADVAVVGSGVLNLAVIVNSWLITTKSGRPDSDRLM